jgi:hypothetical protein
VGQLSVVVRKDPSVLKRVRMRHFVELAKATRRTMLRRFTRWFAAKAQSESDGVFGKIERDPGFYREFDATLT